MTPASEKLAQVLLQNNVLTEDELKQIEKVSEASGKSLEQTLMETTTFSPAQFEKVIESIHEWQFITSLPSTEKKPDDIWAEFRELLEHHSQEAAFGEAKDSAVVKMIDLFLSKAYEGKASDIHLEPERNYTALRYRIDGVMHDIVSLPKDLYEMIVTRIKILSKMRTDEHQAPQDGKLQFEFQNELIDVRVSVVPTIKGETVVMRLLSEKAHHFTLSDLGLSKQDEEKLMKYVRKPWGLILTTGPTGSGKTTSLYAILQILNKRELNIVTIEDPVEYYIEGVTQIQVNPKANLTFATGLRAIVRQDPNIVMVGEIRDEDTADIAINSAMTGHLVLSTIHTNDASTTLPRFIEMQVKPFLVASTINVAIGQRLVRRICPKCPADYDLTLESMKMLMSEAVLQKIFKGQPSIRLKKGQGCESCKNTGYEGRIGIYEILEVTEGIRELVMKKSDASVIEAKAIEEGMTTMLDDAIVKMIAGQTTIEEILRVIKQ